MTLVLPDKWIWDSWFAHDGDQWHVFFLQADKSLKDPDLRHWNVTQGHATSTDRVTWQHHGTCFEPSSSDAFDDYTTWTGSVVQDDDGLWHLFYTGTSRAEEGVMQRIGHAVAEDLHHWSRVGDGLCLDLTGSTAYTYEAELAVGHWHDRAMRDPWVMRDPEGDGWLMYFTARVPGVPEANAGGAIGFATSRDLYQWELQPPVFAGSFGQLEVPQVLQLDDRWYCLFCTMAPHWSTAYRASYPGSPVSGTHYLIADTPRGPWQVAPGKFLDGAMPCERYAARLIKTQDGLELMGFADVGTAGQFQGHVMDPQPVYRSPDGRLSLEPTSTTRAG